MTSPALELQGAIVERLRELPALSDLVAGRVYDDVPSEEMRETDTGAAWPYVSMGPTDEVSDDAECITAFEISFQIERLGPAPSASRRPAASRMPSAGRCTTTTSRSATTRSSHSNIASPGSFETRTA